MAEFNFSFAMNNERNALGKQIKRNEILGKCIFEFWHKTILPANSINASKGIRERRRRKEVWRDRIRWNKRTITLKKFYCALSTSIAKIFMFLQHLWHRFSLMIEILYKSNYLMEIDLQLLSHWRTSFSSNYLKLIERNWILRIDNYDFITTLAKWKVVW